MDVEVLGLRQGILLQLDTRQSRSSAVRVTSQARIPTLGPGPWLPSLQRISLLPTARFNLSRLASVSSPIANYLSWPGSHFGKSGNHCSRTAVVTLSLPI